MTVVLIKENALIARVAALVMKSKNAAIVFGKTIYLHNASATQLMANKKWLRHELRHIEQYMQYGFARFISTYLFESIKRGYYNNKLEADARQAENNEDILTRFSLQIKT